jgi:hypothetical protein
MSQVDSSPSFYPQRIPGLTLISVEQQRAIWNQEKKEAEEKQRLEQEQDHTTKKGYSFMGEPIPINKGQAFGAASKLNSLLQQRRMDKKLNIVETSLSSFSATLEFGGERFTALGPYKSRNDARDAVAQLGVDYLEKVPANIKEPIPLSPVSNDTGPQTSYVAQLQILAQRHGIPLPDYTGIKEVQPQRFAGVLKIADRIFEEPGPFTSKKMAKEAVAQKGLRFMETYEKAEDDDAKKEQAALAVRTLYGKWDLNQGPDFDSVFLCITYP